MKCRNAIHKILYLRASSEADTKNGIIAIYGSVYLIKCINQAHSLGLGVFLPPPLDNSIFIRDKKDFSTIIFI